MKTNIRMRYIRSPGYEDEPLDVIGLMPSVMAQVDLIKCANAVLNESRPPLKFRITADLDLKVFDIEIDDGLNPVVVFLKNFIKKSANCGQNLIASILRRLPALNFQPSNLKEFL